MIEKQMSLAQAHPERATMGAAARRRPSRVGAALRSCSGGFAAVALFSGFVNLLMLTGPIFMLQVYDRVLASRSIPTLVVLFALVALLFGFLAVFEILRGRILTRIAERFDARTRPAVIDMVSRVRTADGRGDGLQPVRDLDTIRQFLASAGPAAIFDLPWVPAYLAVVFAFHPWFGVLSLGGAALLALFAVSLELAVRASSREAAAATAERNAIAETLHSHGGFLASMGMLPAFAARWHEVQSRSLGTSRRGGDISGMLASLSKMSRLILQSLILAVGAYLVIEGEATAGVMIAASIVSSRALAPIEQAVGHWRSFLASRQAYQRLAVEGGAEHRQPHPLPSPRHRLDAVGLAVLPPGAERPTFAGGDFTLTAGDGLAVIGPSGAGKSSLGRGLVGVWPASRGGVRLDGATPDQWNETELGRHIGYLDQDVQMFPGTVAQNISRFAPETDEGAVIRAAQRAGVHDLVVRLPQGYDTPIGRGGLALSAGQRQRIALARAVYGDPFLIVLDEPNSNLDAEGETALARAVKQSREAGSIVIVIAHRPSALAAVDLVLMVRDGRQVAFGAKDEVLGRVLKQPGAAGGQAA